LFKFRINFSFNFFKKIRTNYDIYVISKFEFSSNFEFV
jgi:hypothetical protein